MTTAERQDRVTRWVTIATGILCALTLMAAVSSLPVLVDARGGIQAQRRSDAISSCRSEIRARLDLAKADVEDLLIEGIEAFLGDDMDGVAAVFRRSGAAREARDAAVEAYREAAELSAQDPEGFLARLC